MTEAWLIDKSALWRLAKSPDAGPWLNRINRGLARVSTLTLLEVGFSARSGEDWADGLREPPIGNMPVENLSPRMERRAVEVPGLLARRGQRRAAKVPDLLIAATAELAGLVVVHVDKDLDLIAAVTGQPVERLAG